MKTDHIHNTVLTNYFLKIPTTFSRGQWVNYFDQCHFRSNNDILDDAIFYQFFDFSVLFNGIFRYMNYIEEK